MQTVYGYVKMVIITSVQDCSYEHNPSAVVPDMPGAGLMTATSLPYVIHWLLLLL